MKTDCDHVFTEGVCAFCGIPDGFYQSEAEYLADRVTIPEPQGEVEVITLRDALNILEQLFSHRAVGGKTYSQISELINMPTTSDSIVEARNLLDTLRKKKL